MTARKKPKIAVVGFLHESNTFSPQHTTLEHFSNAHLDYGADLIPTWRDAYHELGGFIQGCEENNLEIVPILAAVATPGGPLTSETYQELLDTILNGFQQHESELDGLLLALHGSMVCETIMDADGETIQRIRNIMGPDFPIMVSMDMHGNISSRMISCSTAIVVYRTYPHMDQRERGIECAVLMKRIVRGEVKPIQALRKLPLLIHIVQQYSESGPMEEIMEQVRLVSNKPGILSTSFAPGYIYADVPDLGASVIVVADGNLDLAEKEADYLAEFAFSRREALNAKLLDPEAAVREVGQTPGLVCLMDCGDNIGGGGPGDSTLLFGEVLKQGVRNCCVVLYDPESVQTCLQTGVGRTVVLEVGAKTDHRHGRPIPIEGRVRLLADGKYIEPEPRHGGDRYLDQGPTAVVETKEEHTIVLNSLRVMPTSLHQLLSLGIRPESKKVIIVKGVTAPRAAYEPISTKVIPVDTPGVTQAGPESFPYLHRPHPLYPLDSIDSESLLTS